MNIQELRKFVREELEKYDVDEASIKTDLLLSYFLNMTKLDILLNTDKIVDKDIEKHVKGATQEIANGKPIQYIVHKQEFMGLEFYVDENVLIPQPDTELLVEETLKEIENKGRVRVLDLCTGSGAIAISIYKYINEKVEVFASDISKEAIEVAKKNAKINNADIEFIVSDMFENIGKTKFDIIVSNPPYIERDTIATLPKEVQNEPYMALDGGIDGLNFYRIIASEGFKHLKENGKILMEIGYNQKESIMSLFKKYEVYEDVKCLKDLGNNDRVIEARIKNII